MQIHICFVIYFIFIEYVLNIFYHIIVILLHSIYSYPVIVSGIFNKWQEGLVKGQKCNFYPTSAKRAGNQKAHWSLLNQQTRSIASTRWSRSLKTSTSTSRSRPVSPNLLQWSWRQDSRSLAFQPFFFSVLHGGRKGVSKKNTLYFSGSAYKTCFIIQLDEERRSTFASDQYKCSWGNIRFEHFYKIIIRNETNRSYEGPVDL